MFCAVLGDVELIPVVMSAGGVASLEASSLAFNSAEAREYPFNFYVEDTSERCYRDVIGCLSQLGWKRVQTYRKRSKVEKRRLPAKNLPLLIWTLNEKDVDFADLESFQLCNHFEGISQLTTKRGFCELLCDMHWISQESHEISPRCYNLGDPLHREMFEEEFKIGAAIMVLRQCLMAALDGSSGSNSGAFVVPSSIRKSCLGVCSRYLRIKRNGDWPGVQRDFESTENETGQINIYGTDTSPEWAAILSMSYTLADRAGGSRGAGGGNGDKSHTLLDSWKVLYSRMVKNNQRQADATAILPGHADTVTVFRIWLVLRGMQSINKQSAIDGNKNLWVVKAPEACRGLGLKVLHRLEDILECERGMGGRSVQKYVENPLLAPSVIQTVAPPAPIKSPNQGSPSSGGSNRYHRSHHDQHHTHQPTSAPAVPISLMKFDIRVWVLVSSFEPLQAHVFSRVYGRRCGLPYDDSTKNLGESLIHLTNYSIQRKNQAVVDGGAGTGETTPPWVSNHLTASTLAAVGASSVKKLRNVCDSSRFGDGAVPAGKTAPASQGDLLMHHEEILQVVNNQGLGSASSLAGSSLAPASGDGKWGRDVWPEIKRKIVATLEATKSQVTHRERSFEFLGYDIILDDDLTPWILEVNMSPAMAHRSAAQNSLIASMIKGLVNVAILPITGTAEKDDNAGGAFCAEYFQDTAEEGFGVLKGKDGSQEAILPGNVIADFASAGGEWEALVVTPPLPSQPVLAQRGALAASTSAASSAYNRQTADRPMSSAQALRNRVINEWSEGVPLNALQQGPASARPRPKSATGTTRIASASSQAGAGGNNFDVSFAAVGRAVNHRNIDFHDAVCNGFGSLLLLQAWARRYVARLRLYHEKRRKASTCMQTRARSFLAKCKRHHLLRARAAIALQCFSRSCAAWRHRIFLRTNRASTRIQTRYRGLLARRLLIKLRRDGAATRIQRWQAHCLDKWRRKAAFKIVGVGRAWLGWRRKNARRVFHLVALHYRRRFRARCQINRGVGRWFRRRKELQRLRRNLAEMAARKGREWALAAMERRKRWDQAVSVKLEIIMYNTIYEMASEMAVEVYAEAVREAAEEEAVAAAAEEERALAMKEIINATFHASQDAVPHNYSELLASLPFGSEEMRSPCTSRSAGMAGMQMKTLDDFILEFNATGRARGGAVASRADAEDEDDEDGLLGTRLLIDAESAPPVPRRNASPPFSSSSTVLPPPVFPSPSPGKERELSTLRSMAASFDSKSIALEREMRLRLLNLATDPATPAVEPASVAAPSFQEPTKSKSAKPYYATAKPAAAAHSVSHHSPAAANKNVRPKSASAVNVKASRHPFPPNVYGHRHGHGQGSSAAASTAAKRSTTTATTAAAAVAASSQSQSQGPADPPAKIPKKRSKASSGTHGSRSARDTAAAAPWEQDVMSMNPYTFMGGYASPPSLDFGHPFPIVQRGGAGGSIGIGSMSHNWSTQPQSQPRREVEDPDVAVYSAATSHLETERSILLSKMLTTLLEKHEDSRSQVFRAAALPLAGYDGYEQRQEYSFQSTAKAGKKRGGGGW